jgi:AcrR family transcriptional regulator
MPTETAYRPPRSRPGHRSLEKLLVAAEDQLRKEELEFFTVDGVLERAGVSVGSFYARFPGKDALLSAVVDRLHARTQPAILAALEAQRHVEQSLEEAVDHAFGILIEDVMNERELHRAFMMLSAFDPVLRSKGEQVHLEHRLAVTAVLAAHRAEIGHTDPDMAIFQAFAMFLSVMHGRLVFFTRRCDLRIGVSDEVIFAQLKLWISSFLRGNGRPESQIAEEVSASV